MVPTWAKYAYRWGTSNVAEYMTLIYCLRGLLGKIKQPADATVLVRLKMYNAVTSGVAGNFSHVFYTHIGRDSNTAADELAMRAVEKKFEPIIYRPRHAGLAFPRFPSTV